MKFQSLVLGLVLSTLTQAVIVDVGFCGDCFCIPDSGQPCPSMESMPQVGFSEEFLTRLRGIPLENPMSLTSSSCNPFDVDANCDTVPALEVGGVCTIEVTSSDAADLCPQDYSYRYVQ
jgi:hypothetical protein